MGKILVIDDEQLTLQMMRALLKVIGHDTIEAFSAQQALEIMQYCQPDAILLDIMLPDVNGIEFCRRLRAHEATAHTPIFMISATAPPLYREAENAGANGYLTKPMSLQAIKDALYGASVR
jgi:CheY-like chemotaxis protein